MTYARLARAALACGALLAFATPPAALAEPVTPQAAAANAEFLVNMPPPPTPGTVCVVDTGVDLTTDLDPSAVERYSVYGGTGDDVGAMGVPKHGTYVAGVIASQADGRGSVGIWPRARIVSVRVFKENGGGTTTFAYVKALEQCRLAGATTVNLSLSGLDRSTGPELAELENKVTDLRTNHGINVVAAAGNSGGAVGYPARFPTVLAVGASDANGNLCSFSSRGDFLDIASFGCGLELSYPGGGVAFGDGTSLAAPVVTAIIGALRAYVPELGVQAAEDLVLTRARVMGFGRVLDAESVFREAGLGTSVDAAERRAAVQPPDPSDADAPVTTSVIRSVTVADEQPVHLRLARPRLRSARYSRGLLRIAVVGIPDYGRAVFTVDGRRYVRTSGKLRMRLKRAPRRVTAVLEIPKVGRSAALTIKLKAPHAKER